MALILTMFATLVIPPAFIVVQGWMRVRKLAKLSPLERAAFDLAEIQVMVAQARRNAGL
jgi:hypothetical protein